MPVFFDELLEEFRGGATSAASDGAGVVNWRVWEGGRSGSGVGCGSGSGGGGQC